MSSYSCGRAATWVLMVIQTTSLVTNSSYLPSLLPQFPILWGWIAETAWVCSPHLSALRRAVTLPPHPHLTAVC